MLDVDSTLSAIEGIDWLAARRSREVGDRVTQLTERAMRGEVPLGGVYADRLDSVRPTRDEIAALGRAYVEGMEPGVERSLALLTNAGIRIVVVTAGLRDGILPLARALGIPEEAVYAVATRFTDSGEYAGFDVESPLTQNGGKVKVVRGLDLQRPILAVGDGITDLELRTVDPPAVDAFAAYARVVERPPVIRAADYVIRSFDELPAIVLGIRETATNGSPRSRIPGRE